jgi:hypothetical protein
MGNSQTGKIKRITANLPEDLVKDATAATGASLTETLIEGLRLIKRAAAYGKARSLKGKLDLSIDMDVSRERTRR